MAKLTYRQRKDLEALTRSGSGQRNRGCTNPTMCALERRGFAELYFPDDDLTKPLRWRITKTGRALLKNAG